MLLVEALGENLFLLPFQLLETTCTPWLVAPSSIFIVIREHLLSLFLSALLL